jgi:cyclase
MKTTRIIAGLDIKGPNVVKGIHNEGLRVVGEPAKLAEKYYKDGADEIIYLDVVASLYQRNLDFDLLKSVAQKIFIPLTVGGGIRSINDINNALRAGADKVAINTHVVKNSNFLNEAVHKFGSQCIVLSVEAKKNGLNYWEAYIDGGREHTGIDVFGWVKRSIELGIGEILLTSVDNEGTKSGFEEELVKKISEIATVPLVVRGGGGSMETFKKIIKEASVDAVCASSVFHYNDYSIAELKKYLKDNFISVRTEI